jgi:hypothetical protein
LAQGVLHLRAVILTALAVILPPAASASGFVGVVQGRTPVTIRADGARAIVYYRKRGVARHVMFSGAINARWPNSKVKQVQFRVDYSGGWKTTHRPLWKTFRNRCGAYNGPSLPYLVAACRAPNGSYWAVQEWQVDLPDFGVLPSTARQKSYSIRISHWSTGIANLEVHTDWVYNGRWHEVFGRARYMGRPVYGFRSTSTGAPLEKYSRLVYLDTFNSVYGAGWHREISFLPHRPNGVFCAGFYPRNRHRPATGSQYRLTLMGPGVTPDVSVTVPGLHNFRRGNPQDEAYEAQQNKILDRLARGGKWCHRH